MRFRTAATFAFATMTAMSMASAQPMSDLDMHMSKAKTAAGVMWKGTLGALCMPNEPAAPRAAGPRPIPARDTWYAKPYKVFDNLYWLGEQGHSSWALVDPKTKDIILIDNLYNYAGKAEIVDGMKAMGLDPAKIKYNLVSHGHGDHDEYVKALQDDYHVRVGLGAPDWDLMDKSDQPGGHPKHDIMIADGQKFTVGDISVTAILTPGHTDGTVSWIFTALDHGKPVTIAYSGGTISTGFGTDGKRYDDYIASQKKMADAAAAAGATVLISNHSEFDNAWTKARLSQMREPGEASPFDVGAEGVARYFKVSEECTAANKDRALKPST